MQPCTGLGRCAYERRSVQSISSAGCAPWAAAVRLVERVAGDAPCAADFVLYPYVGYVNRITFRKPETRLTDAIPEKLAAWAKRIEGLPFFDKTFPPHWR